jgi:hypothetical protein
VAQASYLLSLEILRVTSVCLQPLILEAARNLLDALNVPEGERTIYFATVEDALTVTILRWVRIQLQIYGVILWCVIYGTRNNKCADITPYNLTLNFLSQPALLSATAISCFVVEQPPNQLLS